MIEEVRKTLGHSGKFAALCQDYEYRDEQLAMAEGVTEAMLRGEHLFVEAGTGVGKTVAYLTPAILQAQGKQRVVVATHTINLQGQLVGKDIPLMKKVLRGHPFKAVLMKGRGNFLCLKEIDHALESVLYAEYPAFAKLRNWASRTKTGDIGELDFVFPDWYEFASNPDTCRRQECPYYADRCFYYAMRKKAEAADIIIVNHSLFFSDLGIRTLEPKNAVIPDYGTVIFDEAHHLEDVATDTFGTEVSNYRVPSFLNRLKKRREIAISQGQYGTIEDANTILFDTLSDTSRQDFFLDEVCQGSRRNLIHRQVGDLLSLLDTLNTQLLDQDTEGNEILHERVEGYKKMLGRIRGDIQDLFFAENPNYFRWCEKTPGRFANLQLHLSPVSVAEILRGAMWDAVDSVICTSATLSTSGGFSYIKKRLGAPECLELILGSPFDFPNQAMLYVPEDLGQPSDKPEYADAVAERIRDILLAVDGRAFLLFTSYRMMNSVFDRLVDDVPFRLLRQGEMSNDRLIQEFREDESTCLMGVHSFWEGVDVKGERLSCVIIDKLPFAVPDSPTHKARCDQIEREGGNWFRDYAIPQAQIRLKQGFGRLIRTRTDRGVVAILDSRIHTKFYGKEFLRYLPKCKGTKNLERVRSFIHTSEHVDVEKLAVQE